MGQAQMCTTCMEKPDDVNQDLLAGDGNSQTMRYEDNAPIYNKAGSSTGHTRTSQISIDMCPGAPPRKSVRPLLSNLESVFEERADLDNLLPAKDLQEIWIQEAEKKNGKLTKEDKMCISNCVQIYFNCFNVDADDGHVNYVEFMTFMLGGLHARGAFGSLRKKLQNALRADPTALHRVYVAFESADLDKSGSLDVNELMAATKKLDETCDAQIAADQLLEEMDLDGDRKVDYYEFLSYSLGRRKQPVELIMYDISHGISKYFSGILLGRQFEAIYHTGVLVYGFEYWFGGQLFQNDPPMNRIFGDPLSESTAGLKDSFYPNAAEKNIKTYHLGYTLYSKDEALRYLNEVLSKSYTRDNYDVLTHNCNTFSDDFVFFLTGNHIPDEVRTLPELAMNTPVARLMRPLLNRYLGGFGNEEGAIGQDGSVQESNDTISQTSLEDIANHLLQTTSEMEHKTSTIQIIPSKLYSQTTNMPSEYTSEHTLAQIIRAYKNDKDVVLIDLRWFNPSVLKFVTVKGIQKKHLKNAMAEEKDEGFKRQSELAMAGLLAFHHNEDEHHSDHYEHDKLDLMKDEGRDSISTIKSEISKKLRASVLPPSPSYEATKTQEALIT